MEKHALISRLYETSPAHAGRVFGGIDNIVNG
jgi:hypothetical protein